MNPRKTDRRHFERQHDYARPIIIFLALLAVLEQPRSHDAQRSISFLTSYLILSLLVIFLARLFRDRSLHLPLACDFIALCIFMYLSPSTVPAWFPYLFVCYAAGARWGLRAAIPLAAVLSLSLVYLTAFHGEMRWPRVISWIGLTVGTFASGAGPVSYTHLTLPTICSV